MKYIVACLLVASATSTAAWAAPADYLLELGGVEGESAASQAALMDLRTTQPQPVALLLPAVQKVREAAARMKVQCKAGRGFDACAANGLAKLVIASDDGGRPALSLLDLYARGSGQASALAKKGLGTLSLQPDAAARHRHLWAAVLQGLAAEMRSAKMPPAVIDPILRASPPAAEGMLLVPAVQKVRG